MTLSVGTLESELAALEPTDDELTARNRLAAAFNNYFAESTVSGIAAVPAKLANPKAAFFGATAGLSTPDNAATVIAAGVTAYWGALNSVAIDLWPTTPIVLVPPITVSTNLPGLAVELAAAFASATASGASKEDAIAAMAAAIHAASDGATIPGSVPPASTAPIPIL